MTVSLLNGKEKTSRIWAIGTLKLQPPELKRLWQRAFDPQAFGRPSPDRLLPAVRTPRLQLWCAGDQQPELANRPILFPLHQLPVTLAL